jgi:REP element-mobilizing transposase RayT
MPIPRFIKEENKPYFITTSIVEKISVFLYQDFFDAIIESLKYCQKNKGLIIYGYVIVPNHIHLIIWNKENEIMDIIRDFKRYTAKKILILMKKYQQKHILNLMENAGNKIEQQHQVWEHNNYPEIIETEKFFLQKLNYIHNNPVKRGFVKKPEDWIYSSARNYVLNDDSMLTLDEL